MRENFDVAIIGAGVSGSALATVLARAGFAVLLLEKTKQHIDRVRGEYMVPWGLHEVIQLNLFDDLLAAGAQICKRAIPYDELTEASVAEQRALDLTAVLEESPGALCMSHPAMCDALNATAVANGVEFLRDVRSVQVIPGAPPTIEFRYENAIYSRSPRLIVGADGRGSLVGRQCSMPVNKTPPHHFITGLLVNGTGDWPEDTQTIGVDGDLQFYVFPQGDGRARLYVCHSREQKSRFSGPDGTRLFLDAFQFDSVPGSKQLSQSEAIGPCRSYPCDDHWIESPVREGVVLIGDAAGHNDPTAGQGLSIAMRDVRIVRDILVQHADWSPDAFDAYITERIERMRRLRFSVGLLGDFRVEFDPSGKLRRQRALQKLAKNPELALPLLAFLRGPEKISSEAFTEKAYLNLLGDA